MDFCLIADRLPDYVPGTRYRLADPDYRHMVRFEAAMLRASEGDAEGIIHTALAAVFGQGWREDGPGVEAAFASLLWHYRCGRDAPDKAAAPPPRKALALDYILDGPLIAAAFQQVYGLDLTDPATRLHWWRFAALLQGLPESCQLAQIIGYRTADLSGMRGAQRKFYADAKRRYALPADLEKGEKRVYASKADWDAAFIARLRRQAARR